MRRAVIAAVVSILLLPALAGCTEEDSSASPPITPAPTTPAPKSPTAAPSTPSEREQQRHEDYLAIQETYKTAFAEEGRLLLAGGSTHLSKVLKQTTTGAYRASVSRSLQGAKRAGEKMTSPGKIHGVSMGPWSAAEVSFYACEDMSKAKWVDKRGKPLKLDNRGFYVVQKITATNSGTRWRLADFDSNPVDDFATTRCNGTWYR